MDAESDLKATATSLTPHHHDLQELNQIPKFVKSERLMDLPRSDQ